MRNLSLLLSLTALLALSACAADLEEPTTVTPDFETYSEFLTITADDGTEFIVEVVFPGTLDPEVIIDIIDNIEVVGVTPVEDVGVAPGQAPVTVPPSDPLFEEPNPEQVEIIVMAVDPGTIVENYIWEWIDDIEVEDLEATIDTICPPWH